MSTLSPTVALPPDPVDERVQDLAADLITYLETGEPPEGLFTPDVFCDFTLPLWRLQARGLDDVLQLRRDGHPAPGRVPRARLDTTGTGFLLEVEEAWDQDGGSWYCRELLRCDVSEGSISEIAVYCTGDWDGAQVARHSREVRLLRP